MGGASKWKLTPVKRDSNDDFNCRPKRRQRVEPPSVVGELSLTRSGLGLVLDCFQDLAEMEVNPSEEKFTKETQYEENDGNDMVSEADEVLEATRPADIVAFVQERNEGCEEKVLYIYAPTVGDQHFGLHGAVERPSPVQDALLRFHAKIAKDMVAKGFPKADQPVSNIYESASEGHGDLYTLLEFNMHGDDFDYPEFTELIQPIRPPVWADRLQPTDGNDLMGVVNSGISLGIDVSNDGKSRNNAKGDKIVTAFRNFPGVKFSCMDRLKLLKLAPGGHLGRFIIWTKFAFEKPDVADQGIVIEKVEQTIKEVFGVFDEDGRQINFMVNLFW
ncbi:hypothetical protein SUGI_0760020 [Cryptomeria japonica]|nr:hypothetical protein SUGI_0760020 [Cryptomeria japonica]